MSKQYLERATTRTKNLWQVYALLLSGAVCLLAAWLLHPSPDVYPIGVLTLGVGMLVAAILNPYRLLEAGWFTTLLGIAVFLFFSHRIPGSQVFPAYILAMGLGLLGIAFMSRRGYVGAGAVTPGLLVLVVGIVECLLEANLTPRDFIPFMLSLWLPGIGLVLLGLVYLGASMVGKK
jgi:hypothetical protein